MSNYHNVYFRINTPSYYGEHGVGFQTDEQKQEFYKEVTELFLNNGWLLKPREYSNSCPIVINGKQELYLHPQSFSGIVFDDNIPTIEQVLSQSKLFHYHKIDIYEEVFDMSDSEYIEYLESRSQEIINTILEVYKTKRRNLYIAERLDYKIAKKFSLKRIGTLSSNYFSGCIEDKFISKIFDSLMKQKLIVVANTRNGLGYRTAKK